VPDAEPDPDPGLVDSATAWTAASATATSTEMTNIVRYRALDRVTQLSVRAQFARRLMTIVTSATATAARAGHHLLIARHLHDAELRAIPRPADRCIEILSPGPVRRGVFQRSL
jgi:hypothetical protein